ncbi:hypothetical protein N0V90_012496 [Kalmusia sp. IMI 367209]|nr:hypothetical protein N0V90_012496 [Kalmusia sp. IMI 367209]
MSAKFTQFASLSKELRDLVWSAAAAIQYQQAFVGYDNLPSETRRQPLRVLVQDSPGRKMRLHINEFQALINYLPMASASREARSHAASFCRNQVKTLDLCYSIDAPDERHDTEMQQILEPIAVEPTTLMVTKNRFECPDRSVDLDSSEHLVSVINRMFGTNCIERLVLNLWGETIDDLEKIYWPHGAQTQEDVDFVEIRDAKHDPSIVYMTPDRKIHAVRKIWDENRYEITDLAWSLFKFYEILDISKEKLPRLQNIDVEIHTLCWDDVLLTQIKSTFENGALRVNWNDVKIGYGHKLAQRYTETPEPSDEELSDGD